MSRPGGDNAQKDDVPWWMRYAGRGLGTVGSFSMYHYIMLHYFIVYAMDLFIIGNIVKINYLYTTDIHN